MKADEEDKLFHTDGAWWTFLKSGKWNGENDYTLFVEFVDLMFTALTQGKVDWEKRPMFIKDQDEKIARIQKSMILLGNEMERHPFSDILGSLHQELSSLSHRSSLGSFYTPDSVCQMCAGTVNSADLRRKIENGKTVSILDPACGSARMPRWASRTLLEITGIRVERLQDISEDDAIAEGILFNGDYELWWDYQREQWICVDPIDSYKSLICKINGPETWEKNPWVWVVEFKVIKVKGGSHENL